MASGMGGGSFHMGRFIGNTDRPRPRQGPAISVGTFPPPIIERAPAPADDYATTTPIVKSNSTVRSITCTSGNMIGVVVSSIALHEPLGLSQIAALVFTVAGVALGSAIMRAPDATRSANFAAGMGFALVVQ